MKRALVTGSSGLVGGESVKFLCSNGFKVFGIDNNLRATFAGAGSSTDSHRRSLDDELATFFPLSADIRDFQRIEEIYRYYGPFDLIVHAAGQPVHDWATDHPIDDFQINAVGTINMLENFRNLSPEAVFIQVSTSKVYGSSVGSLPVVELDTRYDLPIDHPFYYGVTEDASIDQSTRSLFGASKAAADIVAQEYGRYLDLKVAIFRPVTITGPHHRGTAAHGYLSHLVNCLMSGEEYTINGFKGKQVRDNIHVSDLVSAFWQVYLDPQHTYGEVYNIGAGRESCNSILEAISFIEQLTNKTGNVRYSEQARHADWQWCVFNTERFRKNYPNWTLGYDNDRLLKELCINWTPAGASHA